MIALSAEQIILSFPKKERSLVKMPDLTDIDWCTRDFLGWLHPSGHLGYIVYELDGVLVGLVLEKTRALSQRPKSCALCLTMHGGRYVNLFTAKTARNKERSVGQYICHDLLCSLYIRGLKAPTASQMAEHMNSHAKSRRLITNLEAFIRQICV